MTGIQVILNGKIVEANEGQSVGAFLLEQGTRITRNTRFKQKPRGMFCGIGLCFDCLITINGIPNQRACVTSVEEGMAIDTQEGAGSIR
ncbi:hydrogen cyanide synthase subunit HcnA [mine drainage metagenome]|uniref:Hydrogen cyanide synthase subunit HcnA n=1 Tax=mine drainage metagenome TaxID=410659 RepID=A0A1J5R268_9ZZZZ